MTLSLRAVFLPMMVLAAAGTLALPSALRGQERPIRIGVLNDMSGPYADFQGPGSVQAAQMAVEDRGGKAAGRKVEVVFADHQNKTDVGAAIARRWIDEEGVDVIVDLPNSAVALAVGDIVKDKNKVMIGSGAGTALLTGAQCSPNTVHWTYDTWSYGHSVARAIIGQGGKRWYFLTADYAFGHDLEKQASDEVVSSGGSVAGAVRHPIGVSDFSSFLLQAQASGADIVGFANAGGDTTNSLKQAAEFGMGKKQKLAALIFGLHNVPALGLEPVQGLLTVFPFYWDMNDGTRAWSRRFQERHAKKWMPNDMHAGVYAGVLHYLKAVDALGAAADGRAVVARMKAMATDDPLFGKGSIREDGRKMHPMYLMQVKSPAESKATWDYFKAVATIDADKAFRPLKEGGCPLVR
ncbi:MAG: ABC transporter substrate-binding protein [Proteobacteria bacterium]|nr:ABC transporter substrate-binding protein [Pseudomonadota bacterium]MBI3496244.1 ABC transporter substrate-binding protein [Pseudomonadota bacterium]